MPALGRYAEDFACKNLYALAYHRSSVTHSAALRPESRTMTSFGEATSGQEGHGPVNWSPQSPARAR